jgi:hypothetical protein
MRTGRFKPPAAARGMAAVIFVFMFAQLEVGRTCPVV